MLQGAARSIHLLPDVHTAVFCMEFSLCHLKAQATDHPIWFGRACTLALLGFPHSSFRVEPDWPHAGILCWAHSLCAGCVRMRTQQKWGEYAAARSGRESPCLLCKAPFYAHVPFVACKCKWACSMRTQCLLSSWPEWVQAAA